MRKDTLYPLYFTHIYVYIPKYIYNKSQKNILCIFHIDLVLFGEAQYLEKKSVLRSNKF